MSFSFRNIFSPDDSEFEISSDTAAIPNGFSAPGDGSAARGNLGGGPTASTPSLTFLVSELLPYIPKAIAAQSGIPMEREVRVPLSNEGVLDVPLSAIYQACPELFAAEITPLNDSVVTLPPRLGATPPVEEASATLTRSPHIGKAKLSAGLAPEEVPSGNPFWSPAASAEATPPASGNPFAPSGTGPGKIAGGFDAPVVPMGNKSPDPVVPARPSPFGSPSGFSTPFSKQAEADASIPFPGKSDAVEEPTKAVAPEKPKEAEGVWGAMFSGRAFGDGKEDALPSTSAPFESIGNLLNQSAPVESAPAPPKSEAPVEPAPAAPASPASPFEGFAAPSAPLAPLPDTSGAFAAGFTAFAPASAEEPKAEVSPKERGDETVPPFEPLFDAKPEPAQPALAEPAVSETVPTPAAPVDFVPSALASPAASAAPIAEASDDLRDLELRAIFSTGESFTLSKVARKVVDLPGIVSCSLSVPGKFVQASRKEESRVGDEAREMVATLRSLAKLTGLPEARTFTLQTDRGIVSLFLEGESCVTVHHENAAFTPGVREKLILVARSLAKLRE